MISRQSPSGKAIRSWEFNMVGGVTLTLTPVMPYLVDMAAVQEMQVFVVVDDSFDAGESLVITGTDLDSGTDIVPAFTVDSVNGLGNTLIELPAVDLVVDADEPQETVAMSWSLAYTAGGAPNADAISILVVLSARGIRGELDAVR
jgi:hypothetical protein